MKNTKKISNVTFVPDLKSRPIELGVEAQKKHDEIIALIERAKKISKETELV